MTVKYQKVWNTMNDLEMVTSKICSAREIIDNAIDKIQGNEYDKAELLMNAAYEFLEYYLQEFDDKFKLAWQATVGDLRDGDKEAYDATIKEREYYEGCEGKSWDSFWESYYPEESQQYTEEELNAMCDKAASEEEKDKCREYNLREAEYYDKRAKLDAEYEVIKSAGGYEWTPETKKYTSYDDMIASGYTMTDDGFWIPPQNKKTWVLPVEQTFDDYFVSFPDDLLKAANLKENDQVEWVDNGNGSYTLRKVTKLSRGESYDDFENPCDMVES